MRQQDTLEDSKEASAAATNSGSFGGAIVCARVLLGRRLENCVGFLVFTAVIMKNSNIWNVAHRVGEPDVSE
jgi:hypothetical protein